MTGYGVSASVLGAPDIGLISFKEMLDAARNITCSSRAVTLCDADTGFGGRLNVMRTVEAYENAGVAASSWRIRPCQSAAGIWRASS